MSSRHCFLHAGGAKTGSTALQLFLSRNRDELSARGFLVPQAVIAARSHNHFIKWITSSDASKRNASIRALRDELERSDAHNVIISSEIIERRIRQRTPELLEFISLLPTLGFNVTFIYYVRNIPQLLNSRYCHRIRKFRSNKSFDNFLKKAIDVPAPKMAMVDALEERKIDYHIRPYNARIRQTGIVRNFLDCIGLSDFPLASEQRMNEAFGPVAVQAALRTMHDLPAGGAGLSTQQAKHCEKILRRAINNVGLIEPVYSGLTTELAGFIEQKFQADNDAFAKRIWNSTWNEAFPDDVGRAYECNDLAKVTPTSAQIEMLNVLVETCRPRIAKVANLARSRVASRVRKSDPDDESDIEDFDAA